MSDQSPPLTRNPKYFHPTRTQPFLITFFQAILAFKKVCKMMRLRIGKRRQFSNYRHATPFQVELERSHQLISAVKKGQSVIRVEPMNNVKTIDLNETSDNFYRKQSLQRTKSERLFREVNKQLESYVIRERLKANKPGESLEDKLNRVYTTSDVSTKRKNSMTKKAQHTKPVDTHLITSQNLFQFLLSTNPTGGDNPISSGVEEFDSKQHLEQGEYLEGTAMYYGSSVAVQARHGGFLSYNDSEVKASAHKILSNSRFVVKKSDDLTDIGLIKYGDALWLQAGHGFVLGAQYGTLVDQKREIQPALVSCKRQSMFKAQQYGRWIILNQEEPIKMLGRPVCHFDRIILEQEWFFLASQSPYESSMYKSISNSDEAMHTKIDLFQPPDECTWKIHLVSLPTDDRDDLKLRQQLLQEAKDQIYKSQEGRYVKSQQLFSTFSECLNPDLKDSNLIQTVLKHKVSQSAEQVHLLQKYKSLERSGFERQISSPQFLRKVYGKDSSIPLYTEESLQKSQFRSSSDPSHSNEKESCLLGFNVESDYWDQAQRLLVPAQSWMELPKVMASYHDRDRSKKAQAAQVLQGFVRKNIDKIFSFPRSMKKIDKVAREKLEEKDQVRKQILLENAGLNNVVSNQGYANGNISSISPTPTNFLNEPLRHRTKSPLKVQVQRNIQNPGKISVKSRSNLKRNCRTTHHITTKEIRDIFDQYENDWMKSNQESPLQNDVAIDRPKSAPLQRSVHEWKNLLMKKDDQHHGLPEDVFDLPIKGSSLNVGVKFLKSISTSNCRFDDVLVLKKKATN